MRFCPNCETERPISELVCEGEVDGHPCAWDLAGLPLRAEGWRPAPPVVAAVAAEGAPTCPNGHPMAPGDLLCPVCGADADTPAADAATQEAEVTEIAGWRLERALPATGEAEARYLAVRDGQEGVLTLYGPGREPDAEVYDVLRSLPRDHVPEILETGRWEDQAFEVSEDLKGGTLADLGLLGNDVETLSQVLFEVGKVLGAFAECGLRHRDLRPGAILVRDREPLDLVVTGFGSARLSEFDLDIVSPLETTRYTAPEALAGGVAAASDWWSLGMVLLEQVTQGACFEGVNDQAFLIHILTNGAPIPEDIDPSVGLLLRGLLARDRHERWGWGEVQQWLAGDPPAAPASAGAATEVASRHTLRLGNRPYRSASRFALAAAEAANWDEARDLLLKGEIATWTQDAGLDASLHRELAQLSQNTELSEDLRLTLALKVLNPAMPLACRGEIITPGWLLDHPEAGYALISGPAPDFLKRHDADPWLSRLKARAEQIRERARQLEVVLSEPELQVHLLSTSRARLAAVWAERRRLLPDTDHPGLNALLERRLTAEEDYILLLSADVSQFRTADALVGEAAEIAARAGVEAFDPEAATGWLQGSRRDLYAEIEHRLEGFARCDLERVDEWADQFRMERRLPVGRALALLAVPPERWREPPRQAYVATLLDFFSKRITGAVLRGPLTRMVIGKTTARLDLVELGSLRRPAAALLDHLLLRNDQTVDLDPDVLTADPRVERRVRTLHGHATLYRRDTGIDGLYLGFPFLVLQESRASVRPRIAPVLLWPIKLKPEVGARGRITLAFDRDREEVRLNPAFEALLGPDAAGRWRQAANDLLGRATVNAAQVMEAFASLVKETSGADLVALPSKDLRIPPGQDQLVCAGALFHLAYLGQAVMEDLRQLRRIPPAGSSLETALRAGERIERPQTERPRELARFFTASSDPSQEQAVLEARDALGLLIEGPPGTGKSQTIVNMVSDAIGRQKSLLIVCQKQSALEVVHKRLVAEGLGDRIVMINDVNKDRRTVIQAIRDQLDALFARAAGSSVWLQQRQQTAARIEALEADLDQHHAALHADDPASGLSYRLVLADLIGFAAGERPPIDVPSLRAVLGPLDAGQVATLQEILGPLARLWLPAAYEDSPLEVLKPFSADEGALAAFRSDFDAFLQAEEARSTALAETAQAFPIEDPEPWRHWEAQHAHPLLDLDDAARERLARWLDLTGRAADLAAAQAELDAIAMGLSGLAGRDLTPAAEVAVTLEAKALADWAAVADTLAAPPTFLQRLSPTRWLKVRRLKTFLTATALPAAAFRQALHDEIALRPWRQRTEASRLALSEPTLDLGGLAPQDLLALVRTLHTHLDAAAESERRLGAHPDAAAALEAARAARREAVDALIDRHAQGYVRHEARGFSRAALAGLEPWFEDAWRDARAAAISEDGHSGQALATVAAALPSLAAYQRYRPRAGQLDDLARQLFRILRTAAPALSALPEADLDGEVRRILGRESRLAWKTRLEIAAPVLQFETAELDAKAAALAQADGDMRKLNRRLLTDGLDATRLRPAREWEDITRLTGQRARRLREVLDRGPDLGLMTLRPVWLMNPDVASRLLPLKKGLFDTVIYDEASQMPIEYALPSLFRSRSMIVSGDEKQMPPTNFFSSKIESDEAEVFEGDEAEEGIDEVEREALAETWNRREIKDCPDLLQLAKTVLPSTTLQIHYRSLYRELIEFSNPAFYNGRLSVPARHPDAEIRRIRPIELVRVDGSYMDQTNPAEAQKVVEVVAGYWKAEAGARRTLGVVTFNRKQADLIEEVLEARAIRDPTFRAALAQERDRIEEGEDMGFFVKNVENVQGDERDIIVFSSTFGRNDQGTFRRTFGVLGQAGGERRLNVAVTRAREKVVLVTSMPIAEISDLLTTRRAAASPRDFLQAYFEYARMISDGELENARGLTARLMGERRDGPRGEDLDQDAFQTAVADYIASLGWAVQSATDTGAFTLDFAIEDPRTGLYGIGIECDAPRHALLAEARAREMWRPSVLRRSIPVVHRVSSHGWFHRPEAEKTRLRAAIAQALKPEIAA